MNHSSDFAGDVQPRGFKSVWLEGLGGGLLNPGMIGSCLLLIGSSGMEGPRCCSICLIVITSGKAHETQAFCSCEGRGDRRPEGQPVG